MYKYDVDNDGNHQIPVAAGSYIESGDKFYQKDSIFDPAFASNTNYFTKDKRIVENQFFHSYYRLLTGEECIEFITRNMESDSGNLV